MKIAFYILFTFLVFGSAFGQQQISLTGKVFFEGKPLPGVTVVLEVNKKGTMTDNSGKYVLPNTAAGRHRLHFSAVGFEHFILTADILDSSKFLPDVNMLPSLDNLENVVVSGTMKAITKMDSPIPVEVYTPVLFKKNPSPNIFESLQMVNGIQPQLNCNVCNTGDIHINGMEGPYTMILIDGTPIVSSLSTVYGLSGIPSGMIKRVEIVKGPASTLYGSEAVGGLINIITKDPQTADRIKADLSATLVGEYNADINIKSAHKNTATLWGINYFNYQQKRDINNDNFTDVTLQDRLSIFNKWNIALTSDRLLTIAGRYIFEERWGGELQWNKNFRGSDSIYGESILTKRLEMIGKFEVSKELVADFSYNYHHQDSYYGTVKYDAVQHVGFFQVRYNKQIRRHNILAGLPLRYTLYDDNTPATAKISGENNPSKTYLPGMFVQDDWKISSRLTTLAGLRYDYNNLHGSILTPRLSFKYSPGKNNTIRLSAGNGYRVVNLFTEDHAALTGARDVVVTEELKPEQSWNINLNYALQYRRSKTVAGFDVSGFFTYFTNKIVGDFITDPSKIIYQNLQGYAISKGITLNTDISIGRAFKANAGFTIMDVYEMDKNANGIRVKIPQLFAPAFSGTYAISYTFPSKELSFDWTGRLNGSMHLPVVPGDFRPARSPLYCIMNLQVTKGLGHIIELYAGAKNLLNFVPKFAILHADDPFNKPGGKYFYVNGRPRSDTNPQGYTFDPSYNYASFQGIKGFLGIRVTVK